MYVSRLRVSILFWIVWFYHCYFEIFWNTNANSNNTKNIRKLGRPPESKPNTKHKNKKIQGGPHTPLLLCTTTAPWPLPKQSPTPDINSNLFQGRNCASSWAPFHFLAWESWMQNLWTRCGGVTQNSNDWTFGKDTTGPKITFWVALCVHIEKTIRLAIATPSFHGGCPRGKPFWTWKY